MKKICVVTGTRAEYGLLKPIISKVASSSKLDIQLIVTGMHLSNEFGLTYKEIESDGFLIDKKVEILLGSDTPISISKAMGLGLISFSEALNELNPDIVLILGDRYEIFALAAAAMVLCIPIAHIHGGEATEGLIDEAIRHSLTKMSQLHFVSTKEYKNRVIQLGENPERIFNVGATGIENIKKTTLLSKNDLEKKLDIKFLKKNLLITFHPVTLELGKNTIQLENLLNVLSELDDTFLIFTHPNSDSEGRSFINQILNFCCSRKNAKSFASLGQTKYFSCIKYVDGIIGNSSSGLIEVPSFKKGTINIGDRQKGRAKPASVIDCDSSMKSISGAIKKLYSNDFQQSLNRVKNPYDGGNSSSKIVSILETIDLENIIKKSFFDIKISQ